jgi:hypothetical protein
MATWNIDADAIVDFWEWRRPYSIAAICSHICSHIEGLRCGAHHLTAEPGRRYLIEHPGT